MGAHRGGVGGGGGGDLSAADIDTIAELNAILTDADLDDLSALRTPSAHAASHISGDAIQSATAAQNGLATSTQISKLDGIETGADVTDATNVAAAGAMMDSDIAAAEGFLRKTGAGAYEAIKSNLAASVAPTANEDSGDGYAVGSVWIDTTADKVYHCADASVGAAVWKDLTGAGGSTSTDLELGGSDELDGNKVSASMGTLTDEATITPNANTHGLVWSVTLGGNRTMAAPTNCDAGMSFVFKVIQDGTGSRTLTWNSVFKWPGGVAPVLTTTAGAVDIVSGVYDGTNWYCSFSYDVK